MLPHEDLATFYDRLTWIYVCRTWDEDEKDLEAGRTHDRFGVTSWPQLFLIDPRDDALLLRTGRSVEAIQKAFETTLPRVETLPAEAHAKALSALEDPPTDDERTLSARLADPRPLVRILALETLTSDGDEADTPETRALLRARLADEAEDVVVRYRALRWLLEHDAAAVLEGAESLLLVPHDPIRFALLDALAKHPTPALTPVLVRLFAEAGKGVPSGNPNVLRGRAAKALATSGDARAIDVLEPMARAANPRNGTTHAVVEALGAIGARAGAEDADRITVILGGSYPKAVDAPDEEAQPTREERSALHLVNSVTKALAKATPAALKTDLPSLPRRWTKTARDDYFRDLFGLRPPRGPDSAPLKLVRPDDENRAVLDRCVADLRAHYEEGGLIEPAVGPWCTFRGEALTELFPDLRFYALCWSEEVAEGAEEHAVSRAFGLYVMLAVDEAGEHHLLDGHGNYEAYGRLLAAHGARIETIGDARRVWRGFCELHRKVWLDHRIEKMDETKWHLGVKVIDGIRYFYEVELDEESEVTSARLHAE